MAIRTASSRTALFYVPINSNNLTWTSSALPYEHTKARQNLIAGLFYIEKGCTCSLKFKANCKAQHPVFIIVIGTIVCTALQLGKAITIVSA